MIGVRRSNPPTIAAPIGTYTHSIEVPAGARWLVTAGQVGVRPDGTTPEGFEAQHEQVWLNTLAILEDAGMGSEDIVKISVFSTDPDGIRFLPAHRERFLAPGHIPASTWVVVQGLARPEWVVEMETVAARVDQTTPSD